MGKKAAVAKKGHTNSTDPPQSSRPTLYYIFIIVIALFISALGTLYLGTLFENDRHFSHLADFEREMAYRTEMGLYFSFYKTLVSATSFMDGIYTITHDNVTEYGHTINTLKRFNLYPEVALGAAFRVFKRVSTILEWRTEACWQVNRGGGLQPVQSCEGIGNLHYFYVNGVFVIAGTVAGTLLVLGVTLSDSVVGGFLAVLCFYFNHGEATRVQWTPPLRESFGYPLLLLQITLVTVTLREGGSLILCAAVVATAVAAMLSWQFCQFVFSTQLCALFVVFSLDLLPLRNYSNLVLSHLISLLVSFLLLFGNEMLLTSMYFPLIISSLVIICLDRLTSRILFRPLYILLICIIFFSSAFGFKILLGRVFPVDDDAHIIDILKSKLTHFANFHTRLYTCSAEFGFIQSETVYKLLRTLVLPAAIAGGAGAVLHLQRRPLLWRDGGREGEASLAYHLLQTMAFALLALLIMRLKLLLTPHLCASVALLASPKLLSSLFGRSFSPLLRLTAVAALVSAMAVHGIANMKQQLSIRGEYSNPDQELLFNWILTHTPQDAVFAGTMPVMANVKLSTGRPILNHPHYEDAGIRARTLRVYSIFSRKSVLEVHANLREMGAHFIIIQLLNCGNHERKECSYRSMWDLQEPQNTGSPSLCDLWQSAARLSLAQASKLIQPFQMLYNQANYIVLKT